MDFLADDRWMDSPSSQERELPSFHTKEGLEEEMSDLGAEFILVNPSKGAGLLERKEKHLFSPISSRENPNDFWL